MYCRPPGLQARAKPALAALCNAGLRPPPFPATRNTRIHGAEFLRLDAESFTAAKTSAAAYGRAMLDFAGRRPALQNASRALTPRPAVLRTPRASVGQEADTTNTTSRSADSRTDDMLRARPRATAGTRNRP